MSDQSLTPADGIDSICIAQPSDLSRPSGGTERILAFASALHDAGVDVHLVMPTPSGSLPPQLAPLETTTVPISERAAVTNQAARATAIGYRATRIAQQTGACLQVEHSLLGAITDRLSDVAYTVDMHDLLYASPHYSDTSLTSLLQRALFHLERDAIRGASHIFTTSRNMSDFLQGEWDVAPDRMTTIPNGYSVDAIATLQDVDPVDGRVVFVGELHSKVDLEALVRTSQLDAVEGLLVIGDGKYRSDLEAMVSDTPDSTITMTGWLPQEKAYRYVASADVAIAPYRPSLSYRLSSPVKLYAYMGLGVPAVVTAGPSAAQELAAESAAVVVGEDDDFPRAVRTVLGDDQLRSDLRRNAADVSESLTWTRRAETLLRWYGVQPSDRVEQ